jgi:hypothetical protein
MRGVGTAFALVTVAAVALVIGLGPTQPVWASIGDPVDCTDPGNSSNPYCDVTAEDPGIPGWQSNADGEVTCRWDGEEVPCTNDWGWFGGDGCYYRRLEDQSPPSGAETPGAGYRPQCIGDPLNLRRAAVWIPDSEAPGPALLAQFAVSRLTVPAPQIELSPPPPAPQLVRLPMWLWVDEATWGERQATASVPGLSVTATATPTEVVWSTGDGGSRTCEGAGMPWQPGMDPEAASPTCGYTYTTSSAGAPGGAYTLTATVTWEVSWVGGGTSGTVDPLTTSSSTQVVVAESRSRNTGGLP